MIYKKPQPVKVKADIGQPINRIDVRPSDPHVYVQHIPAPDVTVVANKPCPWEFNIKRDTAGRILQVIATPKL